MQVSSFFDPKPFWSISQFLKFAQGKGRSKRYQRGALNSIQAFSFFDQKVFVNISITRVRTREKELSTVPKRCPEHFASIFVFRSKFVLSISRFQEDAQVKRRCQRFQRGTLNSIRAFLFFCPKMFLSICRFLNVAKVKVRCQRCQRCA